VTGQALFNYAGARIQARHGQRPATSDWERLRRIGDFGRYLQAARDTGLEPFVRHIAASTDAHGVERALRTALVARIGEVAAWQPAPWRDAVRWLTVLTELPVLHHLASGGAAQPWMQGLPHLGSAAQHPPPRAGRGLFRGALAPLGTAHGGDLLETWRGHWWRLLPPRPARFLPPLHGLDAAMWDYRAGIATGDDPDDRLERALVRTLRRHGREPAAAYAHLGLAALDVQALRRDLLLRRLLPEAAA
jgi:hypothetical protein